MQFLLVVCEKGFCTFERNGGKWTILFVEGNELFPIDGGRVKDCCESYMAALANEKNLSNKNMLEFDVLECSDKILYKKVLNALNGLVKKTYDLNSTMRYVIEKLSADTSLRIKEFGVNYDGFSYMVQNGELFKNEFNLLAFSISGKTIVNCMNF